MGGFVGARGGDLSTFDRYLDRNLQKQRMAQAMVGDMNLEADREFNENQRRFNVGVSQHDVAADERASIERLHLQAEQEQRRGGKRKRLQDIIDNGLERYNDPNPAAANAWAKRHLRVLIDNNRIERIDWI